MKNICKYLHDRTLTHIFAMFFMVLDLRLTKVGTQRSPFFCAQSQMSGSQIRTLKSELPTINPQLSPPNPQLSTLNS